MKSQKRTRTGLLSRVSTLAIIAAAGAFGSVQQAQADCTGGTFNIPAGDSTISGTYTCVRMTVPAANVTNNALIGDPGVGYVPFWVTQDITGTLTNKGNIGGGYFSGGVEAGALTIDSDATVNRIVNAVGGGIGSTSGNGLQIGSFNLGGEGSSDGFVANGIVNENSISSNLRYGIAALYGSLSGGLTNGDTNADATINGGLAAVFIGENFTSWSDGITNSGQMSGNALGAIVMGDGGGNGNIIFNGDITNEGDGIITSAGGTAIIITNDVTAFNGSIVNRGQITGDDGAIYINADTLTGNLSNESGATISASHNTGPATAVFVDTTWVGNVDNQGLIQAAGGEGSGFVFMGPSYTGNFTNADDIFGGKNGVVFDGPADMLIQGADDTNAQFTNTGSITGSERGFRIDADEVHMDFRNTFADVEFPATPVIAASTGIGVLLNANTWNGNVTNDGSISGGEAGLVLGGSLPNLSGTGVNNAFGTFNGTITNNGSIGGSDYGVFAAVEDFEGNFVNTSNISAGGEGSVGVMFTGASFDFIFNNKGTFNGTITNSGNIGGGRAGMVMDFFEIDGDLTNQQGGYIHGGTTGLAISAQTFDGTFTNSGEIGGGTRGLNIDVVTVGADLLTNTTVTNAAGGYIHGSSTGAYITANVFTGDVTNNGTIEGGVAGLYVGATTFNGTITNAGTILGGALEETLFFVQHDPGLIVNVGTYNGDIVNTGLLSANSNALDVTITTLNGTITNSGGTIEATTLGSNAVVLDVGGTGLAGATFVNTNDGVVLGNLVLDDTIFGTKNVFIGEDGGVVGNLVGKPFGSINEDNIIIQNGTQYFTDSGAESGGGTASNFADFTVGEGGFAVMGARYEGDTAGSTGYAFNNVDTVHVNDGGTLYIAKQTTLVVDNDYTQQEGGTLEFFLGAPAGIASATGTIVAGAADYGQLIVNGTAHLGDGTIAGFLDPAFLSANPDLEAVVYNDVIDAEAIDGDFATLALINNNSIFELDSVVDGSTVDLTVTQTQVGHIGDLGNIITGLGGSFAQTVAGQQSGIGSGSCGLAGPGWCFNRFAANEPGATQVMTDATPGDDPFDWLRTGVRRVGETSVWGRGVGTWGNSDGDLTHAGADFDSYGAIVGIDHVFAPLFMAGVAAQWTTTDIDFDGKQDNANVDSFELGGYASYGDTRLYLNANASVIFHNIETTRFTGSGPAFGDYDGTTFSGYVEGGKIFETYNGWRLQPLVALQYSHLDTDSYSETGPANVRLNVFDADFDSLKGMLGLRVAYPIPMESGRKIVPEARIVWAHEFMDDQSEFLATTNTNPLTQNLITGQQFSRDTIILGTGLSAPLSEATSLFLDYDAGLNEDITTHTVSAGFRTRW